MEEENKLNTEEQEVKSNKDKFRENFSKTFPDVDMNDEDAYFGALNDQTDQYAKDKSRLEELEADQRSFGEALDSDPRLSELFLEMTKDGGKPIDFLIEHYAKEFSDVVNDPDNEDYRKALAQKITEDVTAAKERKDLEAESEANIGPSLDALSKVAGEMGLSEEETADAFGRFLDFTKDLMVDKVSEEMWRIFINGLYHADDVAKALEEGEARGRNAKIREKLRSESPSPMNLSSGGSNVGGGRPLPGRSFPSVWDEES